ncbi:MAG: hypothetical protein Fur005_10990 [Roseiflexaceae bacterium]
MTRRTKWQLFAPPGLLLTGLGLILAMHASNRMARGEAWFLHGTIGLVIFNAGLSIFGDAVKERALIELGHE